MAQLMTDEQRLKALEAYDPREHLISVGTNKDRTPVLYYPAAWRLYELRLRHPHFVLEAEIIHMDEERGSVIVKAIGYDGLNYESSTLKGTALKQGRLADLDKVETKAKSRVARDIGIGTEYALDMDADETDAQHTAPTPQPVQHRQQPTGNPKQQPAAAVLDPAEVSLYVGGVYKFQSSDFEKRWTAYKQHVLGEARADAALSQSDLSRLRTFAADEDRLREGARGKGSGNQWRKGQLSTAPTVPISGTVGAIVERGKHAIICKAARGRTIREGCPRHGTDKPSTPDRTHRHDHSG